MADKKTSLNQKLLEIQKQVIGLGKDKSALSYKYVTGDKVLSHIKPLMNSLGVLLKQEVLSIENTRQDYATKNGSRSEMHSKVMMRFTWIDTDSNETMECLWGANGQNDWERGVPSAMTLGERYFLLKFFHIATDEDDIDNPERKAQEEAQKNIKADALKMVADSKMDDENRTKWNTWLNGATPAAILEQMDNLKNYIKSFES